VHLHTHDTPTNTHTHSWVSDPAMPRLNSTVRLVGNVLYIVLANFSASAQHNTNACIGTARHLYNLGTIYYIWPQMPTCADSQQMYYYCLLLQSFSVFVEMFQTKRAKGSLSVFSTYNYAYRYDKVHLNL